MSDFLFPSWFETFHRTGAVPLDYCGRISNPFELLPGGYANVFDTARPADAWTEKKAPDGDVRGRALCGTPSGAGLAPRAAPAGRARLGDEPVDERAGGSGRAATVGPVVAAAAAARVWRRRHAWPPPLRVPRLLRIRTRWVARCYIWRPRMPRPNQYRTRSTGWWTNCRRPIRPGALRRAPSR